MSLINRTYRSIALILALLMFTTSVGFAVDMHYCQGQLKSVSFFGKAKSCHEMADAASRKNCTLHKKMKEQNKGCSIDKNGCCENETQYFHSDQDQKTQGFDITLSKQLQQFVVAYTFVFIVHTPANTNNLTFSFYKPPLIERDIPVLIQSFLL